ncbi:MAG: catalase family peroxidase [Candidatus Acidiferrum sp.]
MPLPDDEKIIALSNNLLKEFDAIFGLHPGFRPAHAKGQMLTGTFTPAQSAQTLSRAPHFHLPSTPVTARFSNGTGIPLIPDPDPNASPRGFAIRFNLAERVHTDIIAHSTDAFPAHTGDEFLEFVRALAASSSSTASPSPVEQFLATHPAALAFVQAPKPAPSSFARENFFGITAMQFTNNSGNARFGRYRLVPSEGTDYLDAATLATKPARYLFDELDARIARASIQFRLLVQLANDGDVVDDATIQWPSERTQVEVGTISLNARVADSDHEQKHIIFDPIPRVDGIAPSRDPLLELRAAIYLISGRRRRSAPEN